MSEMILFIVWGAIGAVTAFSALISHLVFSLLPQDGSIIELVIAAGAILAMLADTRIPEASEEAHNIAGLNYNHLLSNRFF